jgi:DNA primase
VVLTRRELDQLVEKAVAEARKVPENKPMPEEKLPSEEVAALNARVQAALDAAEAVKVAAEKNVADLKSQLEASEQKRAEAETKAEEARLAKRRAKDKMVEANLRKLATKAGLDDEDYALLLYAKAAAAAAGKKDADGNPAPEALPAPDEFFAGLAKTRPALLKTAPPAPPASTTPAAADKLPSPTPAGGSAAAPRTADDRDEREFAASTRSKYGFNPTVAT